MSVVVKIGGHLLFGRAINVAKMKKYRRIFEKLHDGERRLFVVVGGGDLARRYISAARGVDATETACDELGVALSRVNAALLVEALKGAAYPRIPTTIGEVREFASHGKIVVSGGLQPGQSTVAVAALAAEALEAEKLVIATDVEGVYSDDPKIDPQAKIVEEMSVGELERMITKQRQLAGEYKLFDLLSVRILERSRVPCVVVDGRKPSNVKKAVLGEKIGTYIRS